LFDRLSQEALYPEIYAATSDKSHARGHYVQLIRIIVTHARRVKTNFQNLVPEDVPTLSVSEIAHPTNASALVKYSHKSMGGMNR